MCRNIKPLFNYEPSVTDAEVQASALQYVRKVSGFTHPSKANEPAFDAAVERVAAVTRELLDHLTTAAPPRDRAHEIARARERRAREGQRSQPAARVAGGG